MDYQVVANIMFVFFATLFGIVIGSFMNVIIYRIPEGRTVVKGHSMCMTCGHELGALDLVPVFSWLFLGGKCRYCKAPISSRYIKIESFTGLAFFLYAITHLNYQIDFLDPTDPVRLIIFAYLCIVCAVFAALISSMMIYHDTGKSYYGYCVALGIGAVLITGLFCLISDPIAQVRYLMIAVSSALVLVGILALFCKILKKKYTSVDFWLDLPFAFFYTYWGRSIIDFVYALPAAVILLVLPRVIMKETKKDKYSAIVSMCGILLFIIVGYTIKSFI